MIQQKKTDYESPTTAILELRSEGLICQSGPWGDPNAPGSELTENPSFTFDF